MDTGCRITGPSQHRQQELEAILRTLPGWFGIEESLVAYARDTIVLPTFVAELEQRALGFITLREHFTGSWEVSCMAVAAHARGRGLGTALLEHAEAWAASRGGRYLQVKTLAATHPSPEYAETRAFYERQGFAPLEVLPHHWSAANPCLVMIKVLDARAGPT